MNYVYAGAIVTHHVRGYCDVPRGGAALEGQDTNSSLSAKLDITLPVIIVVLLGVLSVLVKTNHHAAQQIAEATGVMALCFLVAAAGMIARLHALVENLNPLTAMVSEYALDIKHGKLMHNAFFSIGGGAWLICLYYCITAHHALWMQITMFGAGLGSSAMGLFSMKSRMDGEIQTSDRSGKLHDISLIVAFGSGTVSMLVLTIMDGVGIVAAYPWLRAAALVQFNITALGMIFFLILGFKKKAMIRRKCANEKGDTLGYISTTGRYSVKAADGTRKSYHSSGPENYGQGVVERILIFLFIQWGCYLSVLIVMGAHK
jgi:Protein of unknown function (DUF998)